MMEAEAGSWHFSLAAALGLSLVLIFSNYLRFLDGIPRKLLLSIGGGVSVTFMILRLLPGVSRGAGCG